jgi:membrane associated rhomboid family serine protease
MSFYGDRLGQGRMNMFPPVIKWLLVANVGIFLLGMIPITVGGERGQLEQLLQYFGMLWPLGDGRFHIWQYATYMFLHGSFAHIFFNMLGLWMFGMELEQLWGSRRFLAYYLLCGLGAGIIHSLIMLWAGDLAPALGASGAIYGVLVAFAVLFPDRIIYYLFLPVRAKYMVMIFIALDLYNGVGGRDGVAHFAHLGGALVGFLLLQFGGKLTLGRIFDRIPGFRPHNAPQMEAFRPQYVPRPKVIDVEYRDLSSERAPRRSPAPQMSFGADQERIDAILDKISRSGYQNLTEEEKTILMEASRRMR